ncbi:MULTISPECIES: hypothetical protein [unclassified Neochlamydia]|nr:MULTISPECIES: hypothetical protein [unclassified Neochlamydia]
MKQNKFKAHKPPKKKATVKPLAVTESCRLGAFFDLLLQIDKRNPSGAL